MEIGILGFLKNYYFIVIYGVALLFSIVRYKLYFDSILKYFPILIGYTLISEILGGLIAENDHFQIVYLDGYSSYNSLILNFFEIIFFLYFFYVFWNVISVIRFKKIIKYGAVLFIISSLVNPFFQDPMLFPQMIASSIGSLVLVASSIFYFIELRSKTNIPYHRNLLFWISLGLVLFYTFYPFILLIGFDYDLYQKLHIRIIHHVLIALMYLCFILGFILMRRIRPPKNNEM